MTSTRAWALSAVVATFVAWSVIRLEAGERHAGVRGRVASTSGSRLIGADGRPTLSVHLSTSSGEDVMGMVCVERFDEVQRQVPRCTGTDSAGTLLLDPEPGRLRIHGSADGFLPRWTDVDADQAKGAAVELQLRKGGASIQGQILAYPAATPLPRAHVRAVDGSGAVVSALSGPAGQFALSASRGVASVTVELDGYATEVRSIRTPVHGLVILMASGASLSGSVVEESGHAARHGVWVSANSQSPFVSTKPRPVLTDEDGRFEISDLAPGLYRLSASGDAGFGELTEPIELGPGEGREGLEIALSAGFRVSGRVFLNNAPCTGGDVRLSAARASYATHGDGEELKIEGVAPGRYAVSVRCGGHAPWYDAPPIAVGNSDVTEQKWLTDEGVRVVGVVRDPSGKPVSDVRVSTDNGRGGALIADVGSAGEYEFEGAPARQVKIWVNGGGAGSPLAEVSRLLRVGTVEKVDFVIDVAGLLVDAVDSEGAAAERLSISAEDVETGRSREAVETARGRYEWPHLAPGTYSLTFSDGVNLPAKPGDAEGDTVVVAVGTLTTRRIVVTRDRGRIEGLVENEARRAVSGATVTLTAEGNDCGALCSSTEIQSDGRGHFAFEQVNPRTTFRVQARLPTGEAATDVLATARQPVVLTIRASKTVRGTVVGGNPDASVRVVLVSSRTGAASSVTTMGREFFATLLDREQWSIRVQASDGSYGVTDVSVADAMAGRNVIVNLSPPATVRGRVVLAEGAGAVDGIGVEITCGVLGAAAKTNLALGETFELRGLPGGAAQLRAYGSRRSRLLLGTKQIELRGGEVEEVGDIPLLETPFSR